MEDSCRVNDPPRRGRLGVSALKLEDETRKLAAPHGAIGLHRRFAQAFRHELRRSFTWPAWDPLCVVGNAILMASCWLFAPKALQDWLFTLHGDLAFPMVLAIWMYSDVPATNVIANDPDAVLSRLDDRPGLYVLLGAKNAVLWLLVSPVCMAVALGVGWATDNLENTLLTMVWIAVVPFGVLGIAAWLGVFFPYHPIPVKVRWEHRRQWWRMGVRWGLLMVTPYGYVPALATVLVLPSMTLWRFTAAHGISGRLSSREFLVGVLVTIVLAVAGWVLGHWVAVGYLQRRHSRIEAFLNDPLAG